MNSRTIEMSHMPVTLSTANMLSLGAHKSPEVFITIIKASSLSFLLGEISFLQTMSDCKTFNESELKQCLKMPVS